MDVEEVFTASNLAEINSVTDYKSVDDEARKIYYTHCLFPAYEASFDEDVRSSLREMGVEQLFDEELCDFSSFVDGEEKVYCEGVQHTTKLTVDRVGIEGAAVTVIRGAGAAGPPEYEEVYLNFVIDKAFGFVLTDWQDVTLFSGVVKNPSRA